VYAAAAKRLGYAGTELILPFRLGIIPLGIAYAPVSAAVMTLIIYSFRVMNRFGTDEETCIGGLSYAVGAVGALGLSAAGTAVRSDEITALGLVTAAALMSGLFFGLAPAKHRSGSSGGSFTGAAAAAGLVLTENLQLCVVFAAAAAFIDALCTAVQFLRYRRTKRLWLMGTSLHHHLKNKMYGEYAVIGVFAVITLTADAAAVWYAVYLYKSYL
jgi:UDP-N-acetylmuramyl pentapeptide phosphotransferase/UDP-N-acetylglucosamine-1-phosphate transferase